MKPHNLHQSVSSTFTFPFSWSKTFLLLGGGGRHGNPWENNFYCSASFLENFLIVYKYLFLDIFYLWLKLPKMYCFVQNVILFLCIEKLLCKMHLCKIDFWLIWVIFQDMMRRNDQDQVADVPSLLSSHKSLAGEQLCSTAPVTPATCSVLCLF